MPLVLDASALIPLAMSDEDATFSLGILRALATEQGFAPTLLWYEVRNVLITERRQRITPQAANEFVAELERLPINTATPVDSQQVMGLARQHHLSIYDAAYLELAVRKQAVIATQDGQLSRAAISAGVKLFSIAQEG